MKYKTREKVTKKIFHLLLLLISSRLNMMKSNIPTAPPSIRSFICSLDSLNTKTCKTSSSSSSTFSLSFTIFSAFSLSSTIFSTFSSSFTFFSTFSSSFSSFPSSFFSSSASSRLDYSVCINLVSLILFIYSSFS